MSNITTMINNSFKTTIKAITNIKNQLIHASGIIDQTILSMPEDEFKVLSTSTSNDILYRFIQYCEFGGIVYKYDQSSAFDVSTKLTSANESVINAASLFEYMFKVLEMKPSDIKEYLRHINTHDAINSYYNTCEYYRDYIKAYVRRHKEGKDLSKFVLYPRCLRSSTLIIKQYELIPSFFVNYNLARAAYGII